MGNVKDKKFEKKNLVVMKFGGASVASAERILHVVRIINKFAQKQKVVVVVSAIQGITDRLISLFDKYQTRDFTNGIADINMLYKIHKDILDELKLSKEKYREVEKSILNLFGQISIYLAINRQYTSLDHDYVVSFGERVSSCLLSAALSKYNVQARAIDSSDIIVANNVFSNAKVLLAQTKIRARKVLFPLVSKRIVPVVTGFFAATKRGTIVTLGRGGSDYSATVLANALDATEVILWKEVDGVFGEDPKKNSEAKLYPYLSYKQAMALAKKGAKVLHPEAVKPVVSKDIIVWVRNVFRPDFVGTKIWK